MKQAMGWLPRSGLVLQTEINDENFLQYDMEEVLTAGWD